MQRRRGSVVVRVLAAMAVVLALGACAVRGDDDASSSGDSFTPESAADEDAGGEDTGGGDVADGEADPVTAISTQADVTADDRQIVYTASLTVDVGDARAAAADARAMAIAVGGRLHDERSSGSGAGASATLVLKVPPERFVGLLDDLGALGEERGRIVEADDVTAEVVDLESRITSAAASVGRTRALLAEAETIGEIVVVEAELAERETTLEQLQGQKRVLDAAIALATITVDFTSDGPPPVSEDETDAWPGPLDALRTGGRSLLTVVNAVVLAVALVLPWTPVVGLAAGVLWWVRRRRSAPAT